MAVKIVRPAPELEKEVNCRNCCTVLSYTDSDIKEVNGLVWSNGYAYIVCPACGHKVILESW